MRNALNRKILLAVILTSFLFTPFVANATGLDALVTAEKKGNEAIQAEKIKQENLLIQHQKAEKLRRDEALKRERAARIARKKAHQQQLELKQKERQKIIEHELAVKKQDNAYQQKLRDLQIQSLELDLKRKKVEVDRTNDVINSNINNAKAQTDLIQSTADSNRNISSGIKSNLESQGKAAVKKESGLFN